MDKKPMYFQLEPNAFLSDIDFQAMTAQERGVYFTLILYLYANGGTVGVAKGTLYSLCNYGCEMLEWEQMWDNIKHKFVVSENGELTHKRVTQEIEDATHRMEVSRESGLRGANKRWAGHGVPIADKDRVPIADKDRVPISKKRKGKVSKEKNNPSISPQKSLFETIRKEYPGTKRGLDEEWDYLDIVCRKHKLNREQTVPKIVAGVSRLLEWRSNAAAAKVFVPPPKNFKTWLYNRCWTDEFPALPHKKTQAEKKEEYEEYEKKVKQYER